MTAAAEPVRPPKWWVGRFSRLDASVVVQHPRRQAILDYVAREPGASFGTLRRELGIGSGSLSHHLAILEGKRLIVSVRSGSRSLHFPARDDVLPTENPDARERILQYIASNPGTHLPGIRNVTGLSRTAIRHHLRSLVDTGAVSVDRSSSPHRYAPNKRIHQPRKRALPEARGNEIG